MLRRMPRPGKVSRTSFKLPFRDCKEQRERSTPAGAKPRQEGHSPMISSPMRWSSTVLAGASAIAPL